MLCIVFSQLRVDIIDSRGVVFIFDNPLPFSLSSKSFRGVNRTLRVASYLKQKRHHVHLLYSKFQILMWSCGEVTSTSTIHCKQHLGTQCSTNCMEECCFGRGLISACFVGNFWNCYEKKCYTGCTYCPQHTHI